MDKPRPILTSVASFQDAGSEIIVGYEQPHLCKVGWVFMTWKENEIIIEEPKNLRLIAIKLLQEAERIEREET